MRGLTIQAFRYEAARTERSPSMPCSDLATQRIKQGEPVRRLARLTPRPDATATAYLIEDDRDLRLRANTPTKSLIAEGAGPFTMNGEA